MSTAPVSTQSASSIWDPKLFWVTIGAVALIFLAAMQALAVTTVMPVVSADLDGDALYAVAFSGTLATSVIGMVVTGAWSDRTGPKAPLYAAVALFGAGLIIAGLATSMEVLVLGRLVQGLGTGGQTVALYVVVARLYPAALHGPVFAAFSAAWVVPSLVGPFLAGAVTELLHWRWVFLGVAVLTALAFAAVAIRLHSIDLHSTESAVHRGTALRILMSVIVSGAVLALSLSGELWPDLPVVGVAAFVVMAVAVLPLLPKRTLASGKGLPSVVLMRGIIAGALFGAEIYVPKLLIEEYGFSSMFAGLGLTAAALTWALSAAIQGRYGDVLGNRRITLIGVALLSIATVIAGIVAVWSMNPAILIGGWAFAGAGMGLMYPRLTVLTLAYSTPKNQGFNSSALSISDSVGAAATIAVMGLAFTALNGSGMAFPAVFAIATALALFALFPGLRMGHAHEAKTVA